MGETVTVEVLMLAFMVGGNIRPVDIPTLEYIAAKDTNAVLELAFKYGQNDFQPKPFPSVSVGDVIRFRGDLYAVAPSGFRLVTS